MKRRLFLAAMTCLIFTSQLIAQQRQPSFDSSMRADGTLDLAKLWSQGRAEGQGAVRFTHSPMRLADIKGITPYGLMIGGHVCPIDHGYFYPQPLQPGQLHFDVMSPADGHIVMVGHRTQLTGSSERGREYDDYALHIEHSGTFYTFYDLLTSLDPAILKQLDDATRDRFARKQMGPLINVRIPVKGGQVVGKVGGRSLDISVINTEVTLKGFLTPKLYGHYAWRVHVVAPFNSDGTRIELPPQMRGVQGVLLAQLIEDRKLKIEVFPSKSAAEVKAFTAGATIYER